MALKLENSSIILSASFVSSCVAPAIMAVVSCASEQYSQWALNDFVASH